MDQRDKTAAYLLQICRKELVRQTFERTIGESKYYTNYS